jgi:hypothetical protein
VYPVILSCLADVAANAKARPFFHEWASAATQHSCAHMLLGVWRSEEKARVMVDAQVCASPNWCLGLVLRDVWSSHTSCLNALKLLICLQCQSVGLSEGRGNTVNLPQISSQAA